ncbi:MAG: class IV adenylate cyclase [Elusimicrobiales bacterium]|jgi:adenylate cyclase class IV
MPSNIEIKARAGDWGRQIAAARALADRTEELIQEDTFFNCPSGRLKLREIKGGESYLIFYLRSDLKGPKSSVYYPSAVKDPASMKALLGAAFGAGKIVKKTRILLLSGATRIHFDEVSGLGRFIELEVCMRDGQSRAEGEAAAGAFMDRLGIVEADLLDRAYADMLA